MEFKKYLKNTAKELDREVENIFKEQLEEAQKTDKKLVPLIGAFGKSCQGGKRIRGCLVTLGYLLGSKFSIFNFQFSNQEILKVAAAYEIMHSAILTHDDIFDKSLLRRGKPSLYKELGGNHYGISQAITLADYGFFLAFKVISEADFIPERKILALELFAKVMMDTSWGEILDLEETDPVTVMKLKTACYTIAGPMQLGAVLAGADQKLIRVLGEFGGNLGIAFQIRDDILDAEEKKKDMKKDAEQYKSKALKVLPEITEDPKMSKILEQMADYLIERNN